MKGIGCGIGTSDHFRFGAIIHGFSLELWFGWKGVLLFLADDRVTSDIFGGLPEVDEMPCANCGTTKWTRCNLSEDKSKVVDCNVCQGYAGGPE